MLPIFHSALIKIQLLYDEAPWPLNMPDYFFQYYLIFLPFILLTRNPAIVTLNLIRIELVGNGDCEEKGRE